MTTDTTTHVRNLRQVRQAAGLSQERLARRLDVSGEAVRAWELGKYNPSPSVGALLSETLGVPLDVLLEKAPSR